MTQIDCAVVALIVVWASPRIALAGMPSLTVTDIARARLETISFFLLLLLISALAVMFLWNWLRRDFARLPRLTYGKSLALVSLWGALFLLVLTMISGARELLTPGAWEKDGATYKLVKKDGKDRTVTEAMRRERLASLKAALWAYAAAHGGALPANDLDPAVPAELWETPEISRARFVYVPGRKAGTGGEVVAYEPTVFGGRRFYLASDGEIAVADDDELRTRLAATAVGAAR